MFLFASSSFAEVPVNPHFTPMSLMPRPFAASSTLTIMAVVETSVAEHNHIVHMERVLNVQRRPIVLVGKLVGITDVFGT